MQASAYIEEHNLQKAVEDVLNATIKARAAEPFSFLVGPLDGLALSLGGVGRKGPLGLRRVGEGHRGMVNPLPRCPPWRPQLPPARRLRRS